MNLNKLLSLCPECKKRCDLTSCDCDLCFIPLGEKIQVIIRKRHSRDERRLLPPVQLGLRGGGMVFFASVIRTFSKMIEQGRIGHYSCTTSSRNNSPVTRIFNCLSFTFVLPTRFLLGIYLKDLGRSLLSSQTLQQRVC